MSSVISLVQNCGQSYSGYAQEVAKNVSYLLPVDSCTAGKTANPMTIPNSGINYSYEIYLRCRCDLAPNNVVNNLKVWYDSGMPASGYNLTVNSDTVSTYAAPSDNPSNKGTRVEFETKNSEESSIALSGELIDVGDYSSYLVFQLEVLSTAVPGSTFNVDFLIQYDEY